MGNRWGVPRKVEEIVLKRDLFCVYCGVDFSIEHKSKKTRPTWEHIVNDVRINNEKNIALCCGSCNASKGAKKLKDWLESDYCMKNGVSQDSVAEVVTRAIINPPTLSK